MTPLLSVAIGTAQGWTHLRSHLGTLPEQAAALGAEVIIADGSGGPPPDPGCLGPGVRWLCRPGTGILELRALAMGEARGDIVAVTEDHCVVSPDWCARILDAHARHPGAAAIRGAMLNGSPDRLVDWASFLVNQAPHLPPFVGRDTDAILPMGCVSYKRSALESRPARAEPWPIEVRDYREWLRDGHALVADQRIWVVHHQSVGFVRTFKLQFHYARSVTGIRRRRLTRRDVIRLAGAGLLPFYRTARTAMICVRKNVSRRTLVATLPFIVGIYCCKGTGEVMGYLFGRGGSPRQTI